ncbi:MULTISPECIES: MFS transporter [Paraburkholderia]|uniref:MFS transporter n=1 Tax=Paraburkholderia TaxID=1822464 RepID=UPI002AB71E0E|nr:MULTISPECIES: MFS transporter [Paraburkholderia]
MTTASAKPGAVQPPLEASRRTLTAIVLGAAIGMALGYAPVFNATAGVFAPSILKEFHWTREQAAVSYAASMGGLAVASPFIGVMMDRFGVRRVILVSAIMFSLAVACMGLQTGSKGAWLALSVIIGVFGAATSVLGYLAILPQWFDRRLGLATGFAMIGLGVGAAAAPAATQHLIAAFHWRHTYQILACVSLAGSLLALSLIKERPPRAVAEREHDRTATVHAVALPFSAWKLATIFLVALLASSATLSLNPHLPALLMDRGLSTAWAATCASLVGVGILFGRLLSGFLMDRFHAPFVGAAFLLAGACGSLLLLNAATLQSALVACGLAGLAIGAEGDLLSYLVRAYLGLRKFGRNYGVAFSGYALGAVVGPIAAGRYFDVYGNYELPLRVAPVLLIAASMLLVSLGRYPQLNRDKTQARIAQADA